MHIKILQDLIDKIRGKKNYFMFLEEYAIKLWGLKKKQNNFHTLILGSSHIATGYIPEEGEYNCATSSQDLYSSYKIYEVSNNKGLKNIILSFSDFAPWNCLIDSPVSYITCYLKILLNINSINRKKLAQKATKSYGVIKKRIDKFIVGCEKKHTFGNYKGEWLDYPKTLYEEDMQDSIYRAERFNYNFMTRMHTQMVFLQNILDKTKKYNQNVYIVITPIIDEQYKKNILPHSQIFKNLYNICENYSNVKILNYFNALEFDVQDFYDWQHLNYSGALKLTKLVKDEIYGGNNV